MAIVPPLDRLHASVDGSNTDRLCEECSLHACLVSIPLFGIDTLLGCGAIKLVLTSSGCAITRTLTVYSGIPSGDVLWWVRSVLSGSRLEEGRQQG